VKRGPRGSGIPVDPSRVKEARLDAGLSLAQLAGDDVSRTFIHFVEQGRSRPSKGVLALIASRTGKPVSYFLRPASGETAAPKADLADDLVRTATRLRPFAASRRLTQSEREAIRLVELTLHQGAAVIRAVQRRAAKGS
jgi:transcriptional regulator with XRE-family HTH domain